MRRNPTTAALLVLLGVTATACIAGRPAPEPTEMAEIRDGLEFVFGDDDLCQSAQAAQTNAVTCDDVRNASGGESFQVAKAFPTVRVTLKPFALDVHEVTNVQYQYCVERGDCEELKGFNASNITDYYRNPVYDEHPVLNVTWEQAKAYCASVKKRLPTQFEWERVAGGAAQTFAEKRRYPWGEPNTGAQDCSGQPVAIFFCGADQDPIGVMDSSFDQLTEGGHTFYGLAGNVSEWVIDYRVEDLTCRVDLSCPDCWNCTDEACFQSCYNCSECWDAPGDTCYALCRGTDAQGGLAGYPVCLKYEQPLFCFVNGDGESECCVGNWADQGGTDCKVAIPADRFRQYRGASYLTGGTQTCSMRSGDRSQGKLQNDPQQRVGFRCAKSL